MKTMSSFTYPQDNGVQNHVKKKKKRHTRFGTKWWRVDYYYFL